MRSRRAEIEVALGEARANCERFDLLKEQLKALLGAARASLDGVVEDELVTAARARVENARAIESFLEPRLGKAFARWWDDQTAALKKLLEEAEAEIEARVRSAGGRKIRAVLGLDEQPAERPGSTSPRKVSSILKRAQKVLKEHHEQKIGMKLGKVREELKRLDAAKCFGDYAKEAGRRKAFRTLQEAERARKIVKVHKVISTLGPVVLELGILISDEVRTRKLEEHRAKKREALREALRKIAAEIADEAWQEWNSGAEEFKRWLDMHGKTARSTAETLGEEARLLDRSLQRIAEAQTD
jgi:uncharacterized protein YukE